MTSKMQMLYADIIASLGQLPLEKRIYVFGDDENVDMDWVIAVANYITLESIKTAKMLHRQLKRAILEWEGKI